MDDILFLDYSKSKLFRLDFEWRLKSEPFFNGTNSTIQTCFGIQARHSCYNFTTLQAVSILFYLSFRLVFSSANQFSIDWNPTSWEKLELVQTRSRRFEASFFWIGPQWRWPTWMRSLTLCSQIQVSKLPTTVAYFVQWMHAHGRKQCQTLENYKKYFFHRTHKTHVSLTQEHEEKCIF